MIKRLLLVPIRLYRAVLSPVLGPRCRFYPTCSAYMAEALERHGPVAGLLLGVARLLRCNPWFGHGGADPVPERFTWAALIRYTGGAVPNEEKQKEPLL